jgi:hypothetical protein
MKYQEESRKVSMVSVSLVAFPPQCGQVVSIKVLLVVSGDSPLPENTTSVGSKTGRFSSSVYNGNALNTLIVQMIINKALLIKT